MKGRDFCVLRKQRGVTQLAVASALRWHASLIQRIEDETLAITPRAEKMLLDALDEAERRAAQERGAVHA